MENKKEKTIYTLGMHETLFVEEPVEIKTESGAMSKSTKKYEVTRVPGGWVYAFEYPGFRQSPIVFVPWANEVERINKLGKGK